VKELKSNLALLFLIITLCGACSKDDEGGTTTPITPNEEQPNILLIIADNIGHYGLNFGHYSHFTSPIRRYPDVIAHRLLWKYLNKKMKTDKTQVEFRAKHSSLMERKAVEAERASKKFMQALFMSKFVGQRFEGTISGVTRFGLFVIMDDNFCEGMVSMRNMDDDHYEFDESAYAIVGKKHGDSYRLGDRVRVKVTSADALARQIDLELD